MRRTNDDIIIAVPIDIARQNRLMDAAQGIIDAYDMDEGIAADDRENRAKHSDR